MGQACVPYFSMYIQVMIVGVIRTCKIWRKWGWGFLAPPFIQTYTFITYSYFYSHKPLYLHTFLIHLLFLLSYTYRLFSYTPIISLLFSHILQSYTYRFLSLCFLYYIGSPLLPFPTNTLYIISCTDAVQTSYN